MNKIVAAALLAGSVAGMSVFAAHAGSTIWVPPSSCTGVNCASNVINTNITSSSSLNGFEPYVIQVMSTPQFCTRLDVLSQSTDLEITVIAPDGTVFRNDDRPGDLRPLVVIPANQIAGWYTVQISRYNGVVPTPGAHYDGALAYGRYSGTTNPNCANPTPATLGAAGLVAKP